jgi:hypothetical protein
MGEFFKNLTFIPLLILCYILLHFIYPTNMLLTPILLGWYQITRKEQF